MVNAVDETVMNITSALKSEGMWDTTLFVFATDNGSPVCGWGAAGSNHPLRGSKATDWEVVFVLKNVRKCSGAGRYPESLCGSMKGVVCSVICVYKAYQ